MSLTVVTYQNPQGATISICGPCERHLTAIRQWPRDAAGVEYCSVRMGAHAGECEAPCHGTGYEATRDG